MDYKRTDICIEIEINPERTSEASALVDRDFYTDIQAYNP